MRKSYLPSPISHESTDPKQVNMRVLLRESKKSKKMSELMRKTGDVFNKYQTFKTDKGLDKSIGFSI